MNKESIKKPLQKETAEQSTGISENPTGLGSFYDTNGIELSFMEASNLIQRGEAVEVPNAGSGSYNEVFKLLGFDEVKVIDWTSSAGDWCFGVRDSNGWWYQAFQSNRYPHFGFMYSINLFPHDTFEDACNN